MTLTTRPAVLGRGGRGRHRTTLLLGGFALSVAIRVAAGGPSVRTSAPAGLLFAACLLALAAASGLRLRPGLRPALVGLAGGAVLCIPAIVARFSGAQSHPPAGSYVRWALIVAVVAAAEESFLRGALFDALLERRGAVVAVLVTSVCFALLHVPLYGWSVVPLDLAVGGWLGALRLSTGSPTAPLVAHVVADLAGWWLR